MKSPSNIFISNHILRLKNCFVLILKKKNDLKYLRAVTGFRSGGTSPSLRLAKYLENKEIKALYFQHSF